MYVSTIYLKNIRGIDGFTALPGMGKSYALRCFAKSLNPNQYHMEYMCLSTISVADFYKQFCSILGVSDKGGKPAMFRAIQEQITYLYPLKMFVIQMTMVSSMENKRILENL